MEYKALSTRWRHESRWWEDISVPVERERVMSTYLPQGIGWALLAKFPEDALGTQKFVKFRPLGVPKPTAQTPLSQAGPPLQACLLPPQGHLLLL